MRRRTPPTRRAVALAAPLALAASLLTLLAPGSSTPASAAPPAAAERLYLVTLVGPGASASAGTGVEADERLRIAAEQEATLSLVAGRSPVYRWADALNGFALRLTAPEAATLAADPRVALVEPNRVRRLAGVSRPSSSAAPGGPAGRAGSGAGQVIGVVDSGIWPEGPLFAGSRDLGRATPRFRGGCDVATAEQPASDWPAEACNGKIVGAAWFVDGFGVDRVRSSTHLSPRDDSGHGTQVASIAAGNRGVTVRAGGESLGRYRGAAPRARIAAYKACWTAPDPADDGCATADLVSAIDRATADGVDVLNLSVGGGRGSGVDTVERALLGAAEGDVAVVAAAGNDSTAAYAAHATPWVTTVGGTTGPTPRGAVSTRGGPTVEGAMASRRRTPRARIVLAARVAAPGADRADADQCLPGSLDAGLVAGKIVTCARGRIGRIDKSAAVGQAGGVGMVLVNARPGPAYLDLHSVPTVHLAAGPAERLTDWLARHPRAEARLSPSGHDRRPLRVATSSAAGDPAGDLVKPDVVAGSLGVLAATAPRADDSRFAYFTGTSAATASAAGLAAALRGRHRQWAAAEIRSLLATSARPVAGPRLRQGSGRISSYAAARGRLVLSVAAGDYRRYLDGSLSSAELNTPSVLLHRQRTITRTLINRSGRARYFSSAARGFDRNRVRVTPAAVRLAPGESATFRVRVRGPRLARLDDGVVVWRGSDGTLTRLPVVIGR